MPRTKKETVIKEEIVGPNDESPNVIAYRVGQLETTVREGFARQENQLKGIIEGFVTEKEMIELKKAGDEEHQQLWAAVNDIKKSAKWWVATVIASITALAGVVYTVTQVVRP